MSEPYSPTTPVPVAQLAQLVDILAALQSVIAGGRIRTDGEFTIEQLGELVIEQVKLKNSAGTVIDPAQSSDVAAVTSAIGTGNTALAEIVLLHRLLRGKIVAATGVTLTCTANATDYTQTVVSGATYRMTAGSGRILLGESDTTSAANVLMVVMPGQTVLYQAQSTSLHYSTVDGAGITARLSRVDMA